jgi:branched-chain amino acid transport system ATP-binding protein
VNPVLDARNLTVRYAGSIALQDASLMVAPGRMVGVAGANGAGKSTLINACAGWSRGNPRIDGEVLLYGKSVRHLAAHQRARSGLMHVPEGKNIFGNLTVEENLLLVRQPEAEVGRHFFTREEIFNLFPRLFERRHHNGSALSGGERQMLAISRALLAAPRILLLDEPSVGLAPRLVLDLLQQIRRLVDKGLPVLLVEQNVKATLEVVDELYLLERGRIIAQGTAAVMRGDSRIAAAYLGTLGSVEAA